MEGSGDRDFPGVKERFERKGVGVMVCCRYEARVVALDVRED